MKKLSIRNSHTKPAILWLIPVLFTLASCDDRVLSKTLARQAILREAMFRDSSQVITFDEGYYEINSESRAALDSLAAAGVITCDVDEIIERHRFEKYTWWEGTKTYYKNITHYFARVSLTGEGRKYVVKNPPVSRLGDELVFSDSLSLGLDSMLLASNNEAVADSSSTIEVQSDETSATDTVKQSEYSVALAKVQYVPHWVLVGNYKIEKVADVFCPPDYAKEGRGTCRFLCSFTDVSPFGRVMTSHKEGERRKGRATLLYYVDSGWQVDFLSFDEY